jgi:glycosyltransferase involved in cell wall biosynthesis
LRILFLHNFYRQPGGEDVVLSRERDVLAEHGHDLRLLSVSNEVVRSRWDKIRVAWQTPYSRSARRRVASEIDRFRPDLVHVHNFFPLLTPSIYDACRAAHVPVIQTLHNFRLICMNAVFFRNGKVCEDCLGKSIPWPGVVHACYQGSRAASIAVGAMLTLHRFRHTWNDNVDLYIAPTDFVRERMILGGLPAHKIVTKPHFVHPDPGPGDGRGTYALFVGRLSPEKGLTTLLSAWKALDGSLSLKIVGDGPKEYRDRLLLQEVPGVKWLGRQPHTRVQALMKQAGVLIFPSASYETFGLTIAEAFASGLPVIAGNLGSVAESVSHGRTGLHFRPGDPSDLAAQVKWLWTHPRERMEMARAARREFELKYSAEQGYRGLIEAYAAARARVPSVA